MKFYAQALLVFIISVPTYAFDNTYNEKYSGTDSLELSNSDSTYKNAVKDYLDGNYTRAFPKLKPYAKKGDALSQVAIGKMYLNGAGTQKNEIEAFKWFVAASEQGNSAGQFLAGLMLYEGRGVTKDINAAKSWLSQASDNGNVIAMNLLASILEQSNSKKLGINQNHQDAYNLYKQAAQKGYSISMLNLAILYAKGKGVVKDNAKASFWIKRACNAGEQRACRLIR